MKRHRASGKLGVAPDEVVVLEDSLNGPRAAKSAGMRCIVAPSSVTEHLEFHGAWKKFDSLDDFRIEELRLTIVPSRSRR